MGNTVRTGPELSTVAGMNWSWPPTTAIVLFAILALCILVIAMRARGARVEDPARLEFFFNAINALNWESGATISVLDKVYAATTTLFRAEVMYYYRIRQVRRRASSSFRLSAYVFGTAGLACPFLETAIPAWVGVSRFGYLLLAISVASLGGNELFGGTRGHIRAVTTQYELERILHKFVIEWTNWRSSAETTGDYEPAFRILQGLSDQVYQVLLAETKEWGTAVSESVSNYQAGISGRRGTVNSSAN